MKVLAVAGASGGHIFPALSFLEELKEKHKDIELLLVLSKRSIEKQFIADRGLDSCLYIGRYEICSLD